METALAAAGFDLVQSFDALACAREPGLAMLADPARPCGLLVGNTRALWPHFSAARERLGSAPHPLERYTEETIGRIAAGATVFYGHRRYDGAFVPLQRLAVAAGVGALAPTQLVIHPVFGPWFALRAVIVHEGVPAQHARVSAPCTCEGPCRDALDRALVATGPDRRRAWLAVRDACTIGREHRYTDEQIAYHYSFLT